MDYKITIATLKSIDSYLDVVGYSTVDIKKRINDSLNEIKQGQALPIDNVIGSSLAEQYKALTKEDRQDLNSNYCDCCLDDEQKNGKCYCSPQYDV